MKLNEAIMERIEEICFEKDISISAAALGGGKSPSSIYDLYKGRSKSLTVATMYAFCEGAGITLGDFFQSELFSDIEIDS